MLVLPVVGSTNMAIPLQKDEYLIFANMIKGNMINKNLFSGQAVRRFLFVPLFFIP